MFWGLSRIKFYLVMDRIFPKAFVASNTFWDHWRLIGGGNNHTRSKQGCIVHPEEKI
jgi:hypothetical protein